MSGQAGEIAVLDLAPASGDLRTDFIAGLKAHPRFLPCKYFYDERGSELFGKICELPEYYITRTEIAILSAHATHMCDAIGPRAELIGFGTGAGTKTRFVLEKLREPVAYVPVDISREVLLQSCGRFAREFPGLEILPICADYLQPIVLPAPMRQPERIVVYFPGSTIGNFEPDGAREFLRRTRGICDALLIGVDLKKDTHIIERAYNDGAGVTAAFNLNLLARANHELGANFDLLQWQHRATFNEQAGRIEMCLISARNQSVRIADQQFDFARGEKITTEYSYKHSPEEFIEIAASAGFDFDRLWTDEHRLFGVFLFRARK